MSHGNKELGVLGERAAELYLLRQGYKIWFKNWRCRAGEIDIIALDQSELVYVEVKTRYPGFVAKQLLFENITATKQKKLRRLSQIFELLTPRARSAKSRRIDVIGVILDPTLKKVVSIEHLKAQV
ncbi:YraN family protein [bacterium]|nr:YraN family protein [bacterium]